MPLNLDDKQFIIEQIEKSRLSLEQTFNMKFERLTKELTDVKTELNETKTENRSLRRQVNEATAKMDDLEQYQRRQSVRIEGLKFTPGETPEQLTNLVKTNLAKIGIELADTDIIRLHRSSKPKTRENDKVVVAQTIIKLSNWKIRERLHSANRAAREMEAAFRVHHGLTKHRFDLLTCARDRFLLLHYDREEIKTLPDGQKIFAFANINSELRIRARGRIYKFADVDQLEHVMREIAE